MNTYIVLLRGINVGGRNVLPMKELVALFEAQGCCNVKTYIQSGNLVLQSGMKASSLAENIGNEIELRYGFAPCIMLFSPYDFESAIRANPFPETEIDPKGLHLGFLVSKPSTPDLKKMEALKATSERFKLINKVFYLYAPEGVGRSKLAAGCERLLGVSMTDRNWRTVCKIRDMAKELDQ